MNTTAAEFWVGNGTGASGTVNQTGGSLTVGNWLAVGRGGGNGTFNLSNGAVAVNTTTGHFDVGAGGGSTGTFNQTGGSVTATGSTAYLGENGTAVYNMSGGTFTASSGTVFGVNSGASGTLTLQGATGATGALANGGGGEQFITGNITFGNAGTAANTINLNGGTLQTTGFTVGAGTGAKTINFNGGTLQAGAANATFLGGGGIIAVVQAGGAVLDTNGNAVTITTAFTSGAAADGGLTKSGGTGTLTLTAANTYVGPTTVNAGALVLTGSIGTAAAPAGMLTVSAAGTLGGTGTFNLGANNAALNGTVAPGAIPTAGTAGTLTIVTTGALTLASTASTQIDLLSGGTQDLITATGARLTLGGTLALNDTAGTGTFVLFGGLAAAPNGSFASVTGVPSGDAASFTYNPADGTYSVTIAAVPEPSTWTLGAFGLGLAAVWLRRRRVA